MSEPTILSTETLIPLGSLAAVLGAAVWLTKMWIKTKQHDTDLQDIKNLISKNNEVQNETHEKDMAILWKEVREIRTKHEENMNGIKETVSSILQSISKIDANLNTFIDVVKDLMTKKIEK